MQLWSVYISEQIVKGSIVVAELVRMLVTLGRPGERAGAFSVHVSVAVGSLLSCELRARWCGIGQVMAQFLLLTWISFCRHLISLRLIHLPDGQH